MKNVFKLAIAWAFFTTFTTVHLWAQLEVALESAAEETAAPVVAPVSDPVSTQPAAPHATAAPESILFQEYLSLDDLLKQPLSVSTLKEVTPRQAPNIVTLITADEIAQTGARDLMDVLRLIPAFEFGSDVSGVVGLSVRGLWAHEGKVLFLLDGQPINEIAYGTMAYGNHFPVDQIQQIEIIRGPGSAIYGGYAELAVINVKTKNGAELNGAQVSGTYSQMSKTYSHRTVSLSVGKRIEDLDVSAHVFAGQGNRSEGTFKSYWGGEEYDMSTASQLNPGLVNLGMKYKGLSVRTIIDEYHMTERDWWGVNLPMPVRADFNTRIVDAQYDWKIGALTLTPRITLKEQEPYQRNGVGTKNILVEGEVPGVDTPSDHPFEIWMKRQTESLIATYDFTAKDNLLVGIEGYQESGETISDAEPQLIQYNNVAAFAQGLVDLNYANLTAGARFERHNHYGNSFVPRMGVTSIIEDFHFKALFSKAFRVPQLETIVLNKDIRPETSRTIDIEAGYRITDKMLVTANWYDTQINDTIIYYATSAAEYQLNAGELRNQGVELKYVYRDDWGFANLGYIFSTCIRNEDFINPETGERTQSIYKPSTGGEQHNDLVIGLPGHKVTLNAQVRVLEMLSINPSLIYFTERYGWNNYDPVNDVEVLKRFEPALVLNLFVNCTPLKGLNLGVGVNDIADAAPEFIQAYYGGHAPIPGASRSYIGKVSYQLDF